MYLSKKIDFNAIKAFDNWEPKDETLSDIIASYLLNDLGFHESEEMINAYTREAVAAFYRCETISGTIRVLKSQIRFYFGIEALTAETFEEPMSKPVIILGARRVVLSQVWGHRMLNT